MALTLASDEDRRYVVQGDFSSDNPMLFIDS
jgi:hypothetical protein